MSDAAALFAILRQSADEDAASVVQALIESGSDRELCRVNVPALAGTTGLDEDVLLAAFLHAARLGLFEMSWNVLCPGCGGVLEAGASLRTIDRSKYECALCAAGYEPTLDEMVEVTFTVSPRIRRIAAHAPDELPFVEYCRQVFWGSGFDAPEEGLEEAVDEITIEAMELPAGEKAVMSVQLPSDFVIVFEPVTHAVQFIDVKGEPTRERHHLSIVYNPLQAQSETVTMPPGPLRLSFVNQTTRRVLPSLWIAGDRLHEILGRRRPFLTAKRLLSNQTFRDVFRAETLDVDQRLRITSMTFLFTDLKGSTELYDRIGDLAAFDLVNTHFRLLHEIVAAEGGAVVKTIGDAVMATFPQAERAMSAALRMREAMHSLNRERGREDLLLKIGIHEGSCLAVALNDRQDFFGQTVNIASRVQGLATSQAIYATASVVEQAAPLLARRSVTPHQQSRTLRGVASEVALYEIP